MTLQTLKGFRDFLPKEAKKRQYVIDTLRKVFTSYGFEPLETPALEYEEILMGKYGEEGDKLMYRFVDNGGRKVAMRYDQTVPLARVVAQYGSASSPQGQPLLPFPFKRYQIQPVWRAENTQKGRSREFLQCDIDTVGPSSPDGSNMADAEIIAVVNAGYQALGFTDFKILVNDRSVFAGLTANAIATIDKLSKIGPEKVREELKQKGFSENLLDEILEKKETDSLMQITSLAKRLGVNEGKIVFEPTLARGLNYYTSMILEVDVTGYTGGSVGGGGRYDNLIGMFLPAGKQDEKKSIPAVGFSFGFERIIEAMEEQNLFPKTLDEATTKVLVTIFNPQLTVNSLDLTLALRSAEVQTEIYLDENAKMEKQLKYADQKGIPFVIIIGPEEKEKNMVTLKNMKTREQKEMTIEEVIQELQNKL